MELMVVVIIIAILAALAIPNMIKSRDDRRVYNDAAAVGLLLRSARLRALGRGAAVAVHATANQSADRGTFLVYEAVTDNPNTTGATAANTAQSYPFSSCVNTQWNKKANSGGVTQAALLVDGLNLNGQFETSVNLMSVVAVRVDSTLTNNPTDSWLCYTPTGRVYASAASSNPSFGASGTFVDMDICIGRFATGATPADCSSVKPMGPWRHVLVPPTGMARVFSK
jgi:Tfp pilus assembly protein FimT